MKRIKQSLLVIAALLMCHVPGSAQSHDYGGLKASLTFIQANDLGRNGYDLQKPIAELMGEVADAVNPECIIAAGDIHHFSGVQSVSDPLWMTNYETIYSHPELMIPWYPVCGNHEYVGNTRAVMAYSGISRRWQMDRKYYTKVFSEDGLSVRIVWLDTTPLIDRYRKNPEKYHDASEEDMDAQLAWLDTVLSGAIEDWIIVVGHHPVYAYTDKSESERQDMQRRLDPILRKHRVDFYTCGHIHNFQHISVPESDIDYIVNSSASLSRQNVHATRGSRFVSGDAGFGVISANRKSLRFSMINQDGKIIYQVIRNRK